MKSAFVAILLLINAVLMIVFIDGLSAVGRYDAGIKLVILDLPYMSMVLLIPAILLLKKPNIAVALVAISLVLFLPLFVHECFPGIVGLFDPAYRSAYGEESAAPFWRFDPLGFGIVVLFLAAIVAMLRGPRSLDYRPR